ncbi:wax ester/triacylglycerol synthase domain-containing protein [Streptomyces sp. NBC_01716]|uniref:wax ester/triacylglycerol synthase domain-containing protein n=1 Tax=Streptomyces sp. NBC_01716 TaxID=2975917 RepID=UPI002E2F2C79|nr:wax ester/triacylglycerol synthase domain-containing protein [Streptomyces sp. NBC_01716]
MSGTHQLAVGWAVRFRGEPPSPDVLRQHVRAGLADLPTLTHRVEEGLGPRPCFVPVPDLDLRQHVRELLMTDPRERWQNCLGEVLARPLPAAPRPPWDLWLIHGCTGTTGTTGPPEYVLVFRIHHALEDGAGHHYVLRTLFTPRVPAQRPHGVRDSSAPADSGGRVSSRAVLGIMGDVAGSLRGSGTWSVLRRPPTGKLATAVGTVRTPRLLALSRALGTDVSAVFLTALTGAMRAVALAEDERPAPLTLLWPVSVRTGGERGAVGNFLTMVRLRLPCEEPLPPRRLASLSGQLEPGRVERRMHTTRALMRRAPRPVSLGTLRLLMRPRHASLTGTYFPAALPQPVLGEARLDGALGLGAPLPGQLCHLTLLRYRAECTLSVVHDTAFPRGADLPELWLTALAELEATV